MRRFTLPALLAMVAVASPLMAQSAKKKTTSKTHTTSSSSAAAASVKAPWRLAYNDPGLLVTMDTSRITKLPDGTYNIRVQWKYSKDQKTEGNKMYRTMLEDRILDCKQVRSKVVNATVYDANNTAVSAFTTPDSELPYLLWAKRQAGTPNSKALYGICKLLKARKA